jgi:hypothetical protein
MPQNSKIFSRATNKRKSIMSQDQDQRSADDHNSSSNDGMGTESSASVAVIEESTKAPAEVEMAAV